MEPTLSKDGCALILASVDDALASLRTVAEETSDALARSNAITGLQELSEARGMLMVAAPLDDMTTGTLALALGHALSACAKVIERLAPAGKNQ